ncbi:Nucleolar 12 [Hyphodiscus hymeniophilus]|uniref:Nucleolar protein 12 n=1 Tax=Hyphodiscus hymeniophilus TaxID=353542 RepID=A0A9P6VHV4_9HELO|nr:Nucleolar 12 [Hyphodiscus hymeniophilus]
MGKRSRAEAATMVGKTKQPNQPRSGIVTNDKAVDPTLALLFASSAGPVHAPPKSRYQEPPPVKGRNVEESEVYDDEEQEPVDEDEDLSSVDEDLEEADVEELSEEEENSDEEPELEKVMEPAYQKPERKRKRKTDEEDLEGKYMQKLAREEEKEEAERQAERRLKRQRLMAEQDPDMSEEEEDLNEEENVEGVSSDATGNSDDEVSTETRIAPLDVPIHESLTPSKDETEIEKASRTVFLANVSTAAISSKAEKKTLLAHMASFFSNVPAPADGKPPHRVESIRFRSTAYAGTSLPKKAAFAKKELMDATTKSTNAYVVYSNAFAARKAVELLNGTKVLDRHLRVDGVAHPAKTDHRRCVFVGNLGFVDDESMLDEGGENERKRSKVPSDIEEGLWRQFGKAGKVESVRVVRDEKTRVGKGFAYVQFHDVNAVEAALLFNEKKYPPMLPRTLRVVRAKAVKKTALASQSARPNLKNSKNGTKSQIYNPKLSSEVSSLQGRAGKLLGRAGAAQLKKKEGSGANTMTMGKRGDGKKFESVNGIPGIAKTPENIVSQQTKNYNAGFTRVVFEGFRANSKSKPSGLKLGGKGSGKKGKGKPKTKSSTRAAAWRKAGGKST